MRQDEEAMGQIYTTIKVINHEDEILAKRGFIKPEEVRSLVIANVLVDTGAMTLCLPPLMITRLGLSQMRAVPVATANGVSETQLYEDAKISLLGREGTFECLALPGGDQPLLGVIPLESLGIEPDLRTHSLRLLPMEKNDTYLTIM